MERAFSKVNNNKTRLRNSLSVNTLDSIVKVSETFHRHFEINTRLAHLHGNAKNVYMEKYKKTDRDLIDEDEKFL